MHQCAMRCVLLCDAVDNTVEFNLTKSEGMHWWRNVMEGDEVIDTQQVEPENSKLTDLDPETRTTVEKMMVRQSMCTDDNCRLHVTGHM